MCIAPYLRWPGVCPSHAGIACNATAEGIELVLGTDAVLGLSSTVF